MALQSLTLRERKLFVVGALASCRAERFGVDSYKGLGPIDWGEYVETVAVEAEIVLSDEQVESLVRQLEQDLP